jgi:DNA polymerase-3 subunit epsilon
MASYLLRHFIEAEEVSSTRRIRQAPKFASQREWVSARGEPQEIQAKPRGSSVRRFPNSGEIDFELRKLLRTNKISISEIIGDDAPQSELDYVEMLLEALEDLRITPEEIAGLESVAQLGGVDEWRIRELRLAVFQTAVESAWIDGRVSRKEKEQIDLLALMLGLDIADSSEVIYLVENKRKQDLGQKSRSLPSDWSLGDPLRVGDAVVFTGCEESGRQDMEARARSAGLRVVGSVSGKTRVLVSDGTMFGSKLAKAEQLGIRIVTPQDFQSLLDFIQPSI